MFSARGSGGEAGSAGVFSREVRSFDSFRSERQEPNPHPPQPWETWGCLGSQGGGGVGFSLCWPQSLRLQADLVLAADLGPGSEVRVKTWLPALPDALGFGMLRCFSQGPNGVLEEFHGSSSLLEDRF